MKSPESKSSTPAALQHTTESNPFFSKARSGVFDPDNHSKEPFFSGIHPVQAKLKIHPADDAYEKEADAVADQVVKQVNAPPPIQRKEPEEENIQALPLSNGISSLQTQRAFESPTSLEQSSTQTEDNFGLQTKAGETVSTHSSGLESQLQAARGSGNQLPESTRSHMESGFGSDFSGVHVHTNSDAVQMNRDVGARAFTHGNDIYFNQGEYQPATKSGAHLIAHELTHTVQQGAVKPGAVQHKKGSNELSQQSQVGKVSDPRPLQKQDTKEIRSLQAKSVNVLDSNSISQDGNQDNNSIQQGSLIIQKAGGAPPVGDKPLDKITEHKEGKMERSGSYTTLTLKDFPIKNVPTSISGPFTLPKTERNTDQYAIWKTAVEVGVKTNLVQAGMKNSTTGKYRLDLGKLSSAALIGTETQLIGETVQPDWNSSGTPTTFQIEHIIDWQLAGEAADVPGNMILLEHSVNLALGNTMLTEKNKRINNVLKHYKKEGGNVVENSASAFASDRYIIKADVKPKVAIAASKLIKKSELLDGANGPLSPTIIKVGKGELKKDHFLLKPQESGVGFELSYNKKKYRSPGYDVNMDITGSGQNKKLNEVELVPTMQKSGKIVKTNEPNIKYPANDLGGNEYAVPELKRRLKNLFSLKKLSPIDLDEIEIGPEFHIRAKGKVLPTVPLIKDANIIIIIDGDSVSIGKEFNSGEIKFPKPFKVSNAFLGLYINSETGFLAEGRIEFGIEKLGEGYLAGTGKSEGLSVEGEFNFDSKIFSPARVIAKYENEKFTAEGEIGIPKGKIKGLKGANAKVSYAADDLNVAGAAQLDIPGLKKSDLAITYANQELTISGALELGKKLPGLKSANGQVEAKQGADGEWKVKASGTAEPDIPGISSSLSIAYDDGIIDMSAMAAFEKGLASGTIQVGITNRIIGPDGKLGTTPTENLTVYGGGQVAIKITPWLKATVGVKLLPSGEIEVLGRIELPSNVEVFPRKEFNKNLFKLPTIEIPIFAIPLGPKSLGLVAQINGGLDFNAGIGPGQIQSLFGEIKYNPSHPEQTTLSGGGRFVIPADAGLKLHADLTLGLSVAIASLTGGIEMAASVGLKGEASASVNLNWNPTSGLELNALGEVKVSPRFKFDLNLLARAKLDLWVTELSKEWRYNLASYEWGPGFDFGLRFPIHYKEGQPFNISFEDIEVIKPNIDILQTVKGIARDIKNKVF